MEAYDIDRDAAQDSVWPKVIGILSLIYALLGMLCTSGGALWGTFGAEYMMKLGGIDLDLPMIIKLQMFVFAGAGFLLGIVLLVGAAGTLRRRRSGVSWMKRWVVLRLLLLIAGVAAGIFTFPAQVDFQRQTLEAVNEMQREAGREGLVREVDEEAIERQVKIGLLVGAIVPAIYPAFLGFYLSRRKIDAEIKAWD